MNAEQITQLVPLASRILASLASVAAFTAIAYSFIAVNATTVGFAYLVLVLLIASTWGVIESSIASLAATLAFNFFFLPPVGTLTIADPQNWVALFSFLTTSLVASRLSTVAKQRAQEAIERRLDIERLYTFSRSILLIDAADETFPKALAVKLAEIFQLSATVLFDRRTGEFFRGGPSEFEGMDEQLRDSALHGTSFSDLDRNRTITAIRLGSEPIGSLALQGPMMADAVLQGVANLVAIGLERARAQDLFHQIEAARQSEELRTALIDAMAHEFKTPLTSIRAATTSLLSAPEQSLATRMELLGIADEEAEHLRDLIDNAVEMARLDSARIEVQLEPSSVTGILREVVGSISKGIEAHRVDVESEQDDPEIPADRRLIKLALKQLVDNALKYSEPDSPVSIVVHRADGVVDIDVTDCGSGIPASEQARVFDRFWRSSAVKKQQPGSGLGLGIALAIARAHNGNLTVTSRPGTTTFRLSLPTAYKGRQS